MNLIKTWRDREQLTQREAARRLGVSVNTLINWETDSVIPDKGHRRVIARVLDVEYRLVVAWCVDIEEADNGK